MPRGDRLEVEQRIVGSTVTYLHHGIDVGDGTVVHARPHDFRNPFGGGRVIHTSLTEFANGRSVRLRNDPPARFSPDEVAERALAHVGRDGYDLVVDNCEHFATWCATGCRASRQVDIVMGRVAAAVSRAVAAVSAGVAWVEQKFPKDAIAIVLIVGLNGLLIVEGQDEREFYITAAPIAKPCRRLFHLRTTADGNQASVPAVINVLSAER